ncbi:MAG: globin-coupled sensor protein [Alphaproteobacteria bacterium]|nr:globin-coupled sensor protein [Alphaproteobacteria bacterium]
MSDNLSERLAFLGIDEAVRKDLREAKPFIDAAVPAILAGFYDYISEFPPVARMFSGREMMSRAASMQEKHWALITAAEFDDKYYASVRKIGEVHNRIQLEPRWYIGGYNFIACAIFEAVSVHLKGRFAAEKRNRWLTALNRAVMLDMDIAISVYLDAGRCQKKQLLDMLAQNFESSVSGVITSVSSSASEMQHSAEALTRIAKESKEKSMIVGAAAAETSQTSSGVAAASEELSSAIREISSQIQKSSLVTKDASDMALSVTSSMQSLLEQTKGIGQVTEFINNVAGQINLLALNATIESARAGEAGRGFAVVASEVKNLAGQTTKASEDIGQQVQRIQTASTQTEEQIKKIVEIISQIDGNISSIAAAVEEQSAATNEIAKNVTGTSEASNEVSRNIAIVEQGAEQTDASSHEVLESAAKLTSQTTLLRKNVDEFLATIRAS